MSLSSIPIINPINGPSSEELETSKMIPNPDVSIKISPLATASIAGIHIEIIPPCVRWTNWIAVTRIGIQLHLECTLNMYKGIHTEPRYTYTPTIGTLQKCQSMVSQQRERIQNGTIGVVRIIYFLTVVFKPNSWTKCKKMTARKCRAVIFTFIHRTRTQTKSTNRLYCYVSIYLFPFCLLVSKVNNFITKVLGQNNWRCSK